MVFGSYGYLRGKPLLDRLSRTTNTVDQQNQAVELLLILKDHSLGQSVDQKKRLPWTGRLASRENKLAPGRGLAEEGTEEGEPHRTVSTELWVLVTVLAAQSMTT